MTLFNAFGCLIIPLLVKKSYKTLVNTPRFVSKRHSLILTTYGVKGLPLRASLLEAAVERSCVYDSLPPQD